MKVHEYQARALLAEAGVPVPASHVVETVDEAVAAHNQIGTKTVVKAQVFAGGRGKAGFVKLCDTADIIVENFRAGTLGFFGLDYETLTKRNPRLIYASITGYGQGGPWRSRMAYAPTVQAEAGFTENSVRHYGAALSEPRTDSLSHADVYAGLQAVIAILAACIAGSRPARDSTSMSPWPRR